MRDVTPLLLERARSLCRQGSLLSSSADLQQLLVRPVSLASLLRKRKRQRAAGDESFAASSVASFLSLCEDSTSLRVRMQTAIDIVIESAERYARRSGMTDKERDDLDDAVAETIDVCSAGADKLKRQVQANQRSRIKQNRDMNACERSIISSLYDQLRQLVSVVKEQQQVRIAHAGRHGGLARSFFDEFASNNVKEKKQTSKGLNDLLPDLHLDAETPESLALENEMLEAELHSELDEALKMEKRVAQLSQLIATFNTKVVEQHEQIESIHEEAVTSNAHVENANEQLQQATERGSSFARFVTFFILLLSFMLLFMDWYQ